MYKIVEARDVGLNIKQFVIEAPRIARKQRPGQFLILRLHEKGERIPLTIKSFRSRAGHGDHRGAGHRQDHLAAQLP